MIDTDKKKYIAELCASVYGSYPRDVVPVQIVLDNQETREGKFFIEHINSGGQVTKNGRVYCKGVMVANNVFYSTGDAAFGVGTTYGYECTPNVMVDKLEVSGSGTGACVSFVGYQCIM